MNRAVLLLLAAFGTLQAAPLKVFVLAGQSNMEGKAKLILAEYQAGQPETSAPYAPYRRDGKWAERDDVSIKFWERKGALTAGYGSPGCIGPELGFGWTVGDALAEPVLLIKTAWGGRSLWRDFRPPSAGLPPQTVLDKMLADQRKRQPEAALADITKPFGESYRAMLAEVKAVLTGLPALFPALADAQPELAGLIWFQGWNDMINADYTAEYAANLAHFIRDVRRDLGQPKLPVVVGQMGVDGDHPNDGIKRFKAAQAAAATLPEFAGNVTLVPTDVYWDTTAEAVFKLGWREHLAEWNKVGSDYGYHYLGSARTMLDIGAALGRAALALMPPGAGTVLQP